MKRTYNITEIRGACQDYGMDDEQIKKFESTLVKVSWNMLEGNSQRYATNVRRCMYDGKTYESISALGRELNVAPQVLFYYIRNSKPFGGSLIEYADQKNEV